jgi:hypothetical protein
MALGAPLKTSGNRVLRLEMGGRRELGGSRKWR